MTWQELESDVRSLAAKINTTPDLIVGVARGGVIPAVLLSNVLKVKDLYVLKVRKEGERRRVVAEIFTDVSGKKVLVVEDMLETGQSMVVAKAYLESKGALVKTAFFYTMPTTQKQPDFSISEIKKVPKFPLKTKNF